VLLGIIEQIDGWVQRFIVGQTLSGGTEGSGLGGTGVAGLHAETKHKLIAYDAENLAETLTTDLVRPILRWLYPRHSDMPVFFKFDVDTPDPESRLRAMRMFFDMGGELIEDSARQVIGENAPTQDDKVLSLANLQAQQQPAIPGDGDGDGIPNEDQQPTDEDYEALLAEMEGAGA
jgi:phage gp29-like protein